MTRALIVDDHTITRAGLRRILSDTAQSIIVGEAANGAEAMELIMSQQWDIVMLDISLPDRSGLEVLKSIKNARPALPVLVLSMYPVDQYALRVLRAGGAGYLTKESAPDQLLEAVRRVTAGMRYITSEVAECIAQDWNRNPVQSVHETLSDREFEVMRLIASGRSVGDIAKDLSLSVKTVSTYRARVLQKLRLRHNAELTHYAVVNNLIY
ncbi:MAG: response regulator transcription factor [Betaproteobacteria bacterium]|nr:response regulator transcription factor [Betaproteobacteria bacterium]